MTEQEERLSRGLRHDRAKASKAIRQGSEKGVRVYIPKAVLLDAGIDPDAEPPTFRMWADPKRRGSVLLRFYR